MRTYQLAVDRDREEALIFCDTFADFDRDPKALFIAKDESGIIAVLGADWTGRQVQIGPMLLTPGNENKRWAILRLFEHVEDFLARAGVDGYVFSVAEDNPLRYIVERSVATPYAAQDGLIWYSRKVKL